MRIFGEWLGRGLILAVIVGAVGFFGFLPAYVEDTSNNVIDHEPWPVSAEAQTLHDDMIVGDWHADSLLWSRDLTKRGSRGQVDIPRLIQGGSALQMFTAVTKSPAGLNYEENSAQAFDNITLLAFAQMWPPRTWNSLLERALYQAQKLHDFEMADPEHFKIILSHADLDEVLAARATGRDIVGGLLGIEGAHPLEGDLANLDKIEAAGYRMIALQHFFDNKLGGSLHGQANNGLTDFGRSVVAEVAKRNLVLDVAHSSPQVAWDVLEMTDIPIVVSHTGIHSYCDAKRNFPDDLMQAIAATGGVIAMGYWAEVSCDNFTPDGIAEMIVAAIATVGEDHVSLGSDYDGSVETPFDTSELPALTHALLAIGVSEAQIRKVMGENMVRVLRDRLQ
ncbi:MAG: membrane dipeptidase [Paracoccaceae bacterium]|jgi:membrane dipeptidase